MRAQVLLGDINTDGAVDTVDRQLLSDHILGKAELAGEQLVNADANFDGIVDIADLVVVVLKSRPLLQIASSSPSDGEQSVAVTRETIFRFNWPLDPATVGPHTFHAHFGSAHLPARVHLGPDGKTVSLFYDEALPASAVVRVTIEEALLRDIDGGLGDLDSDGDFDTAQIEFETLSLSLLPGTSVVGRVFATELATSMSGVSVNVPLEGVRITVDGLEDIAFAVTDANGDFRLDPAPAGKFFVHIDGRTVTEAMIDGAPVATQFPEGPYYPFVGKSWEAVALKETSIGEVYLPLVMPGTLQPVSATEDTVIHFTPEVVAEHPEFANVSITVPANSLFADDGARGGMVGIAPVPPDRMPGPLPEGVYFPVVITVQTDGATNFDRPVPVCFPNLPNPVTLETLGPGEETALWSFDHDTGLFSVVGPMTVNEDGTLVCTDPGVGLLAPGWHGTSSGSGLRPFGPSNRPCNIDGNDCASAVLFGTVDCVTSFIPAMAGLRIAEGCFVSGGLGAAATIRDCALGSDASCMISAGSNTASTAASCIPAIAKSVPFLGSAISCGLGAFGVLQNCSCIFADLGAGGEEQPQFLTDFQLHLSVMEAYENFYLALFGTTMWTSLDKTAGNPTIIRDQVGDFFGLLVTFLEADSDGGNTVTAAESAMLHSLTLPVALAGAPVDALILRYNVTMDLWGQGLETHAEAGRTDFIDRDEVLLALDDIDAALTALNSGGYDELNLGRAFSNFLEGLANHLTTPEKMDLTYVYYHLRDLTNNQEFRGRLDAGGNFGIGGIAPNSQFELDAYYVPTGVFSLISFSSEDPGVPTNIPTPLFVQLEDDDADNDLIPARGETIIGTLPDNPDTDGDGIKDGLEIRAGTNPLDGIFVQTGIIATIDTEGTSNNVHAANERVALADGEAGVSVFNVYSGMAPAIIAQVDTRGAALGVASEGTTVVAYDDAGYVSIIDASNLQMASVVHEIGPGSIVGNARTIDAAAGIVYVGSSDGALSMIDIDTGLVIHQETFPQRIDDVFVEREHLYFVTTEPKLYIARLGSIPLEILGSTQTAGLPLQWQLFVGGNVAYLTQRSGYNTINVQNPMLPMTITNTNSTESGWHQTVFNGSGLAVGARGIVPPLNAMHNVVVFDASDPAMTREFLIEFATPGSAVGVEIYNGLAYVADTGSGMHVVNYTSMNLAGDPPTVSFTTNAESNQIVEGARLFVDVTAADDGQIRNVDLLVNGLESQIDGKFPFQFYLSAPRLAQASSIVLEARATDTGGNRTLSGAQTITILPDNAAPFVLATYPRHEYVEPNPSRIQVKFSEPLNPGPLTPAAFTLTNLGADGVVGGSDDFPVAIGALEQPNASSALLIPAAPLATGVYQVTVNPTGIVDLSGNAMQTAFAFRFGVRPPAPEGVNYWRRLVGGSWRDPINWSSGVPDGMDTADLNVPGPPITVTVPASLDQLFVRNIQCFENLVISGGRLVVNGEALFDLGAQILSNGLLRFTSTDASLICNGPLQIESGELHVLTGADITVNNLATGPSATLTVESGGVIRLPNTTALNGGLLRAATTGTFDAPVLANIDNSRVEVLGGAQLGFPLVTSYMRDEPTAAAAFNAQGLGSELDLTSITSLDLSAAGLTNVRASDTSMVDLSSVTSVQSPATQFDLFAFGSGTVKMPLLTSAERLGVFFVGTNGVIDLAGLQTITGGRIDFSLGNYTIPNLQSVTDVDIFGSSGDLNLPSITSLADLLINIGEGAEFIAPGLSSLDNVDFRIRTGSSHTLPNAVTAMPESTIEVFMGAQFAAPMVSSVTLGSIILTGTGTLSAPLLANIDGSVIDVRQGANLTLPLVTSYTAQSAQPVLVFRAIDAGSTLAFPALASFDRSAIPITIYRIEATSGGLVDLDAMTTILSAATGTTQFTANGAGSIIDLSALSTYDPARVQFTAISGGQITLP